MPKKHKLITAEDLWKIQRPSSPSLSPDASQVCVAVTKYDMEANKGSTHLWLLSTFGGDGRELTQCGEKDGQPQWSPDGSLIAFVAKRGEGKGADEEPQLYVIAPDGGEGLRPMAAKRGGCQASPPAYPVSNGFRTRQRSRLFRGCGPS